MLIRVLWRHIYKLNREKGPWLHLFLLPFLRVFMVENSVRPSTSHSNRPSASPRRFFVSWSLFGGLGHGGSCGGGWKKTTSWNLKHPFITETSILNAQEGVIHQYPSGDSNDGFIHRFFGVTFIRGTWTKAKLSKVCCECSLYQMVWGELLVLNLSCCLKVLVF